MTAISAPAAVRTVAVRTSPVRKPLAIGTVIRRVGAAFRTLDSLFAAAAEAPSNTVPRSLALLRINR
jgi:hypothetical protein